LEQLAFNALPATFKKDMTAHQYDQQCNQVICSAQGEHPYVNNGPTSNLYGLEPNFGCCTANLHQAWPKFVSHLWMTARDGGLAAVAYAPCLVETTIQTKPVKVAVETAYPFRDRVRIAVTVTEPMEFPLHLRVPVWAEKLEIDTGDLLVDPFAGGLVRESGILIHTPDPRRGSGYLPLRARWTGTKTISLRMPMPARLYRGYNEAAAVTRGPLVFALSIDAGWKKIKDNPQFADWEVYPKSPWNYALQLDRDHPERSVTFEDRALQSLPFSPTTAPVIARAKGRRLASWGLERGAAAPPPPGPVTTTGPLEELMLLPYGCTDLRVTEFPVCP
jgi:hypothetical protein